jgi:hypothetical protein
VRVLLFLVLFHMFFRSASVLYPWQDWRRELHIERMPRPLPTQDDLAQMRQEANGSYLPVMRELQECAASLPRYWCPCPTADTRKELTSAPAWGKYSLAWTASRLRWCEGALGFPQGWDMYSPSVGQRAYPTRARLLFADGTEITIRQRSDPEDLTWYFRWYHGKILGYDSAVTSNYSRRAQGCHGYCNWLAHRLPHNAAGAPLREIRLYQVTYNFPPPGADARAFLVEQMEQARDHQAPQAWPTFFIYDPDRGEGQSQDR